MVMTRLGAEQAKLKSTRTGDHVLDTYLEACEKGNRTLYDILSDIFDDTTGIFRAELFEFREDPLSPGQLQFRVGVFVDPDSDWADMPSQGLIDAIADVNSGMTGVLAQVTIATTQAGIATTQAGLATTARTAADADVVLTHADVVLTHADVVTVAADKATVASDKATVATDKGIVAADKAIVIADMGTVAADKAIVIADMATTLSYKNAADADVVLTHADVVLTHADAVQTALDRIATAADVVLTHADVVLTHADVITVAADKATVAADKATVAADKATVIADTATVAADKAIVIADMATVAADKATVAADKATTLGYKNAADADATATAADRVQTGLDRVATAADVVSTAASAVSAAASAATLIGTSVTSLLIAVASKTFTTQSGKAFAVGRWVLCTSDADTTNYMHGQVTAYSGTTLTVNVTNIGGSGTKADWTITVAGTRGAIGNTGATGSVPIAAAGGTADAITADYTPDMALSDMAVCLVVPASDNATTTPTFAPDGLTAHTITKNGGGALVAGDIKTNRPIILEYNLTNTRWELCNPAKLSYTYVTGLGTMATETATDYATKSYVDAAILGLENKAPCRVATTAALTVTYLAGVLTNAGALAALQIDGVNLATSDRVLVKNQASALQNGWYSVTTVGSGAIAWVMTRTSDADAAGEIAEGDYSIIEEGTANTGTFWIMTHTGTITIGTTAIDFTQLTATSIAASSLTGTTLASNVTASSLTSFGASPALGTPASGVLTNCTGTAASLTAGTVTTNANLTGDVTSAGNAATIAAAAVTLAKMANLAQDQMIIRTTASTGVPETATCTAAARTVLDDTTVAAMRTTLGTQAILNGGTAGGTANAQTLTPTPALGAYAAGVVYNFLPVATNTSGTVTMAVSGLATRNIKKFIGGAVVILAVGDLTINSPAMLVDDGTQFILMTPNTYTQGADVASATTTDLDVATGDYVFVTGTTTITGVTLAQGRQATVKFGGILTFTNGASLILPGGANITTAAGDTAILRGEASGVVRCIDYIKASGKSVIAPAEADLTFTDITTNDASTTKHGFLKKLDNTATNFMNGTGAWSVPAGTAAGVTQLGSTTPGAVATVDFTGISATAGRGLVLMWTTVSNVNAANCLQVSPDFGAGTFADGLMDLTQIQGTTVTQRFTQTEFALPAAIAAANTATGAMTIMGYQSGPLKNFIYAHKDNTGATNCVAIGYCNNTTALVGLRCKWTAAGNYDLGTLKLYAVI